MGKCVLAVDDSKTMRDMVSFTLRGAGYTVVEADNGVTALKALQAAAKVDVIITDVNMPEMDGITLVRKIRAQPQHAGTPVLILTTESDQSKKDEGRSAGATGWIVKPFSPDKLLQIVAKVCP
ncbi:response regulator [Paramagnetospirillum kuznetsovii]|uniref:Response regulator n=1 Tax=Paramagnetospirillum kuznetsovii TaxID=2053833 RepID=A0A364NYV4_9PROT|nr:response regulator [Paramagnetospirillum kuznetsovii]RAU22264.1 response regulator [Paramagnetospirillum kuznetsovii]